MNKLHLIQVFKQIKRSHLLFTVLFCILFFGNPFQANTFFYVNPSSQEHVMVMSRNKKKLVFGLGHPVKLRTRAGNTHKGMIQSISPDSMQVNNNWIAIRDIKRIKNTRKKAGVVAAGMVFTFLGLVLWIGGTSVLFINFARDLAGQDENYGAGCTLWMVGLIAFTVGIVTLAFSGMANVDHYTVEVLPASAFFSR